MTLLNRRSAITIGHRLGKRLTVQSFDRNAGIDHCQLGQSCRRRAARDPLLTHCKPPQAEHLRVKAIPLTIVKLTPNFNTKRMLRLPG
ncbi:MAG: hypothetical protein OEU92_14025 [Alphaproteobacteria bacterium]|nr:hypothetical protein [Alphaproteobacteria bacterium]